MRARRRARRLLRARRPLAAGDPGRRRALRDAVRRGAAAARALRGARPSPRSPSAVRAPRCARPRPPQAPAAACRVPRDGALPPLLRAAAPVVPRPARARERASTTSPRRLRLDGRARRRRAGARAPASSSRRHEVAAHRRSASEDGQPVQVIHRGRAAAAPGRWTSARLPAAEREAEAAPARRTQEAAPPVRSGTGPAAAAPRLLRLGGDEHVLLLTLHHIVSDGWSVGRARCASWRRSTRPSPRASPRRCPRCRSSTRTSPPGSAAGSQGEALERQLAYWKQQLAGAPQALELPTDRPRPPVQTLPRRAPLPVRSPRDALPRPWRRSARREGATLFMTLLAAFQRAAAPLHRARTTSCVGTPIAEPHPRRDRGADRLLRQHARAARATCRATRPSASCSRACARRRWAPTPTRTCPSSSWCEALQPERRPEPHAAVPGDVRRCRTRRVPRCELPGLHAARRASWTPATSKFDLTAVHRARPRRASRALCEYSTDLFDAGDDRADAGAPADAAGGAPSRTRSGACPRCRC